MIGYRWFQADFDNVRSLYMSAYKWQVGWNKADAAPTESNTSGLYSFAKIDLALGWCGGDLKNALPYAFVLGTVELAGVIVKHEFGYRSQYARIRSFFVPLSGHTRTSILATAYNVPLELVPTAKPRVVTLHIVDVVCPCYNA